ncbi:MAG TPA: hypothetical protein VHX39_22555 [Acetobacteraceae bacterium]|jgi:hypothetical protein|nr:hypothetical protein [Acetobacteraceae bacterium]
MMIEQGEQHRTPDGAGGSGTDHVAEGRQLHRMHFEVLLTGDSYPLSRIVTYLVESAMRMYPAGCESTITSRV